MAFSMYFIVVDTEVCDGTVSPQFTQIEVTGMQEYFCLKNFHAQFSVVVSTRYTVFVYVL